MSLLQMSLSGAALIAAVIVIRSLLIHKISKTMILALWGIAVARLLIPAALPSDTSIYTFLEKTSFSGIPISGKTDIETENSQWVDVNTTVSASEMLKENVADTSAIGRGTGLPAKAVWFTGVLILALYFSIRYIRCIREFRTSLPVKQSYAVKWMKSKKVRRFLSIRETRMISAPLTYGILRPVILMPKRTDWQDEGSLKFVLEHEYIHICRFDAVIKLVLTASVCIHWFNPLVWVMYILANRDIELSCDEKVIRFFGNDVKSVYARTLISIEESKSTFVPLGSSFGKNAVEERIVAIMKYKKASALASTLAAVLMISTTAVFATTVRTDSDASLIFVISKQTDTALETASEGMDEHTDGYSVYKSDRFPEYERCGLSYNETMGYLMYEGKTVGYFKDEFESDTYQRIISQGGELGIEVIRDGNGDIAGLNVKQLDAADGGGSDGYDVIVENAEADSSTGYEEGDHEAAISREYKEFGLTAGADGAWYYKGKSVAVLYDSEYTLYVSEAGVFYLNAVRDKDKNLTALEEVSEEEMQKILDVEGINFGDTRSDGDAVSTQRESASVSDSHN